MSLKPQSSVVPVEDIFYRCPGCGETVDQRRMDDVLEHHRHVLHQPYPPSWFTASREAVASPATPQRRDASRQESPESSAAARLRRYGH